MIQRNSQVGKGQGVFSAAAPLKCYRGSLRKVTQVYGEQVRDSERWAVATRC